MTRTPITARKKRESFTLDPLMILLKLGSFSEWRSPKGQPCAHLDSTPPLLSMLLVIWDSGISKQNILLASRNFSLTHPFESRSHHSVAYA